MAVKPASVPGNAGDGPGSAYQAQFNADSMFPAFDPGRRRYVTRCAPGKVLVQVNATSGATVAVGPYPARSGRFAAEARPLRPGFRNRDQAGRRAHAQLPIRCLLVDFPDWTYARLETLPRGMFLVSFRAAPQQATRSWAVVFDQEGMPRWWFNPPTSTSGAPTDGHEYTRLENGNVLIDTYRPRTGVDLTSVGGPRDAGVLDGEIQEFTPSGKVVWTWNSGDHVPLEDTPPRWWKRILGNPHPDADGNERYDIFHLNSIEPRGPGMLVVSSRHTDKVFGISRKTGGILWNFGGRPDPRSLKVEGTDPLADYPIAGNHDTRIAGNLLSVHDSGTNLGRSPRALRYRIDLKAGTATYAGQFTDPAIRRSHCCGGFTRCARSATGSGQ